MTGEGTTAAARGVAAAVPEPAAGGDRIISILELTAGQVEAIEVAVGLNISRWNRDAPSLVDILARVASAVTGEPVATFKGRTMRWLAAHVSLDTDADPDPLQPQLPSA